MFVGIGWPNGPTDNKRVLALPGPLLMLSSEHWHVQEAQNADHKVVYRAMAREGYRPAELGWNASDYAAEILRDVGNLQLTDFIPANELDLNYERGDDNDDFNDLANRYRKIGIFLLQLLPILRASLHNVTLHFPAFTPDHDAVKYIDAWGTTAQFYDVIDIHAYDSIDNIQNQYITYSGLFPDKSIVLTEWHCKGDLGAEREVIKWLNENLIESYFFIYEWFNAPRWWDTKYDIAHNEDRYDMFMNREVVTMTVPDTMPRLIDVSNNNGHIEWGQVASSGVVGAIIKASEGVGFKDGYFPYNWSQARKSGIYRGAYDFARPDLSLPEAEADFFLDYVLSVGLLAGDILALDIEDFEGSLNRALIPVAEWVGRWLIHVKSKVGFMPMIYSTPSVISEHGIDAIDGIKEYGLWLASWRSTLPQPPYPWEVIALWQYTSDGSVPGIQTKVDLNAFNGAREAIPLYGKPASEEPTQDYVVGPGVLSMMEQLGDTPASNEVYSNPHWSETVGVSGNMYRYIVTSNRTFVTYPDR